MSEDKEIYANIRDILGPLIGQRLVDITQHDRDEYDANGLGFVQLLFDDGSHIKFYVSTDIGFDHDIKPR